MHCYCCETEISFARKVKLRRVVQMNWAVAGPDSAAYQAYKEQMTYRWAVICQECYELLDQGVALASIAGQLFNMSATYRDGRARIIDERQYQQFQRREAKKLGVD